MFVATAVNTSSSGPSVDVHGWAAWIIILGGVALALGAIWKVVVPFVKACFKVATTVDTLAAIAQEFRPNTGTSLHDTITRIDAKTTEAVGLVNASRRDLVKLHNYTHAGLHDVVNAMTTISPGIDVLVALASKMGAQPERLEE